MAFAVTMPKLGLTMSAGTVAQWRKKEGDTVAKGEILFVVATDKLTFEVEVQEGGTLLQVLVPEGKEVAVGALLAYLGEKGELVGSVADSTPETVTEVLRDELPNGAAKGVAPGATRVSASPLAKKVARETGVTLVGIKGTGPDGMVVRRDVELAHQSASRVKTSPVAKRIAEDLGVDVASLARKDRIMKADVLEAAPLPREEPRLPGVTKRIPVSPMRRVIADRMSESSRSIPVVTYNMETDCTGITALRNALRDPFSKNGIRLSFTHILMKICAQVLAEMPMANASIDGNEFVLHDDVNIGIAVAVEGGLLVPNLKGVQTKTLSEIARDTEVLVEKARSGKLQMTDMQAGTFTITNLGMFGINDFTPIINPPEACIMAMNAIVDRPVVREGQIVVRPMTVIGITADHRIIDGVDAARFLSRVRELMENPYLLLA
jgi:pyruvate dehydrogenase E2 component (dihydrolipoamide acetyltransferase)